MVTGQNIKDQVKDQERKEQENKKNNLGAYIFAAVAAGNAAKQLGLLKGFQEGGQVPEDDPLQIGMRMKMGASAYPGGVGIAMPQPQKDPLQIEQRMANPSMYQGSNLGPIMQQAKVLNQGMQEDTINKARKSLQLIKLMGILEGEYPESIQSSGNRTGMTFPDPTYGTKKRKMSDVIKYLPFNQ